MYTKLYHNKRPGIWCTPDSILLIYKILALFPKGFEISKHTALRTEFDDSMVTATPDLFSNGNHFANGKLFKKNISLERTEGYLDGSSILFLSFCRQWKWQR